MSRLRRVAFLTLEDRTGFVIDDAIVVDELRRRGVHVEEIPWRSFDGGRADWDVVVVRTTWDYQRDLDGFLASLAAIEARGVPLANTAKTIAWNAKKTYLRELADEGVPIVPTVFGEGMTRESLRALAPGVVKPIVSANADDTFRLDGPLDDATVADIARRFAARAWMAQPFVRSVLDEGEISLFYFDGRYSHAIRKVPKSGDFRVQEEHGGLITPLAPTTPMRAAGDLVLQAVSSRGEPPFQARVDLVRLDDGTLALMELEAIEPSLYFRTDEGSAGAFVDGLERWLARRS